MSTRLANRLYAVIICMIASLFPSVALAVDIDGVTIAASLFAEVMIFCYLVVSAITLGVSYSMMSGKGRLSTALLLVNVILFILVFIFSSYSFAVWIVSPFIIANIYSMVVAMKDADNVDKVYTVSTFVGIVNIVVVCVASLATVVGYITESHVHDFRFLFLGMQLITVLMICVMMRMLRKMKVSLRSPEERAIH